MLFPSVEALWKEVAHEGHVSCIYGAQLKSCSLVREEFDFSKLLLKVPENQLCTVIHLILDSCTA